MSVELSASQLPALSPAPALMPYALPLSHPCPLPRRPCSLWCSGLHTPALVQISLVLAGPRREQSGSPESAAECSRVSELLNLCDTCGGPKAGRGGKRWSSRMGWEKPGRCEGQSSLALGCQSPPQTTATCTLLHTPTDSGT